MVPRDVLKDFLTSAKEELESIVPEAQASLMEHGPSSSSLWTPLEIRSLLLERQRVVLERIVANYNDNNDAPLLWRKTCKRHSKPSKRRWIARTETNPRRRRPILSRDPATLPTLQANGSMARKHLMDLFALCQAAVKLPCVQQHVAKGTPLFANLDDDNGSSSITTATTQSAGKTLPQERLQHVQRLFLTELGYDADFGTKEIQRIFVEEQDETLSNDPELFQTFVDTVAAMNTTISQACLTQFSDVDQGGVTRVVAVSEKVIDPRQDNNNDNLTQAQSIHAEDEQRHNLRVASQAAATTQFAERWKLNSLSEHTHSRQIQTR